MQTSSDDNLACLVQLSEMRQRLAAFAARLSDMHSSFDVKRAAINATIDDEVRAHHALLDKWCARWKTTVAESIGEKQERLRAQQLKFTKRTKKIGDFLHAERLDAAPAAHKQRSAAAAAATVPTTTTPSMVASHSTACTLCAQSTDTCHCGASKHEARSSRAALSAAGSAVAAPRATNATSASANDESAPSDTLDTIAITVALNARQRKRIDKWLKKDYELEPDGVLPEEETESVERYIMNYAFI